MTVDQEIQQLSKMELRKKYKGEANSHRNMLARRKSEGATVHPAFHDFSKFLAIVGPKPTKSATLDRINYLDHEYAPGKVRWADKRTQSSNKTDAHLFAITDGTNTFTTAQLAKQQGVSMSTIRKRFERGWKDDEIIAGQRQPKLRDTYDHRPTNPRGIGLFTSRISHAQVSEEERPRLAHSPSTGGLYHLSVSGEPVGNVVHKYHAEKASDILWQRKEDECIVSRHLDGEEYCIPTWDEFVELAGEYIYLVPESGFEGHFWKWWLQYREHIRRDRLHPHQIAYIEKLEAKFSRANLDILEDKPVTLVHSQITSQFAGFSNSDVTNSIVDAPMENQPYS